MDLSVFLIGLVIASLVLVLGGYALAFALGGLSVFYLWWNGFPLSFAVIELGGSLQNFTMLAIPLFMLSGALMNAGRITERIFAFAKLLVGRIPGGLGHVNVFASLVFAGMSGSVLADVAGLGRMEYKAMRDEDYEEDFAMGVTLSSAAIGPILPPSVPMVLFGLVAEVSITGLFLGGIMPAFVITGCLMAYVYLVGRRKGYYSKDAAWSLSRLGWAFLAALPPLMTPVLIVGGMVLGIFSPTEAAVVAVLYALFLAAVVYRDLGLAAIFDVSREVVIGTGRLMFVIAMSLLFGWVLSVGRMPQELAGWIGGTFDQQWAFLLLLMAVIIFLGAIVADAILLLILAPMIVPIAVSTYGMDPLHLGVVMVFTIMIGQFTPPMGMSLFIMRDITGLPFTRVCWAVAPFLLPLIAALLVMAYVPQVVLFIPRALGF
ncbi:MAG: TRAP transporter large permease [Paracoccaceae bacterium]